MMLFTNYLTSAWRNILNHKLFSAINILGLAIGLAAVMLIALFVRDELSYDNFWTKADNIYRAHISFFIPGRDPMNAVSMPGPVIHALKKDFPQITNATRIGQSNPTLVIDGNYFLEDISLVDSDIVNMFDFNVVAGDLSAALNDNSSLVLNQTIANKYFGEKNPINQVINIDFGVFKRDYKVAAIIKDMPTNSQINIKSMISIDEEAWKDEEYMFAAWFSINAQLFFELKEGENISTISDQINDFINRNFPLLPFAGPDKKMSDLITIKSVNIKDLHLKSIGFGEYRDRGDINTVLIFSAVATLILIIASINFMNLSTARASQRAKEVSLRKVMGASRKNLIFQFLGESILLTLLGLIIALSIVELTLPIYNEILTKQLFINYASVDFIYIIILALSVGTLAGTYPAFILSSFRPVENLKANKSVETSASAKLRAVLVIFQFAVSIALFVSTAVVYGQMLYAKNMDLGYDHENLLIINDLAREDARAKLPTLVKELRRMPQVSNVTWSRFTPGSVNENNTFIRTPEMSSEDVILIGNRGQGYEYFKTYKIPMVAGREYDINRSDLDVSSDDIRAGKGALYPIIINQSGLRKLGFKSAEEAIGKIVYTGVGSPQEKLEAERKIIGVVPDVHFDSLKKTIRPEIYDLDSTYARAISIRFSGDPTTMVDQARALWQQEIITVPFDYNFAEDSLAKQYQAETGQATLFAAFSGLAIFIACLGLYGLASFTAERRTKEIGIRKIMGATIFDIVKLLLWQFSKPVMIANLIAWPISYYAMTIWLESFVYRIESFMIIGFCLMAGLSALLIAWSTVASNSIRVAKSNPINALRYE